MVRLRDKFKLQRTVQVLGLGNQKQKRYYNYEQTATI